MRPFLPGYGEADPFTRDYDYHQAASQMNDRVLARMLAGPSRTGVITVLAGGGGSGKSTASDAFVPESDFTFDTTLSSPYWAEKLQEQIRASGREMDVVYVHRRFPLAVDNMVRRYLKDQAEGKVGRIVPLPVAISAHIGAQETILGLKGSRIKIIDNNGEFGDFHQITLEDLAKDRYINTHEQDTGGTGGGGTTARRGNDSEPERGGGPRQTDHGQDHRRAGPEARLEDEGRWVIEDYRQRGRLTDAGADAFLGKAPVPPSPQQERKLRSFQESEAESASPADHSPTTTGGSPPSPPGNTFRNPDGTLPTTPYHRSASDPDLAEKEAKFNSILTGPIPEADAAYNAVPDAHGGKVIGTDLAREVLPEYRTADGRTRYSGITTTTASQYGKDRLWREIHHRGGRESLLFTAGGPGSGKSTVVNKDLIDDTDLIYDGTLRDQEWAIQNIEEASKQGWLINVVSVTRPLKLVAVGVVERAIGEGRTFALADLPDAHYSAQRSAVAIARYFEGNSKVSVDFYYNGGITRETPTDHITLEKVDTGGEYSYDTQHGKDRGRIGEMVGEPPESNSQSNDERFRTATRQDIIGVFRDAVAGKITYKGKPSSHEVLSGLAGKDPELLSILKESGK